ncbi:DUF302 domain-containing protein [Eikenella sp. S3360]|uniref:DUF302 domain-containing protein n=1 Tax=Eikenella glucosivorans TaxID=2766967 RepID=A0ABS0NCM3_9NEIS|nr:DUF302 domain-containing protein [Eikenella glucosivorans]MBH5330010.1 DUF302 domain-containing protein [Eikenella glucosivorans]
MNPEHFIQTSPFDFQASIAALKQAFAAQGLTLFAEIPHSDLAAEHGLPLAPACLLIVGHPAKGTPLMQADLLLAAELPLKVLVYEENGRVWVLYRRVLPLVAGRNLGAVENVAAQIDAAMSGLIAAALEGVPS